VSASPLPPFFSLSLRLRDDTQNTVPPITRLGNSRHSLTRPSGIGGQWTRRISAPLRADLAGKLSQPIELRFADQDNDGAWSHRVRFLVTQPFFVAEFQDVEWRLPRCVDETAPVLVTTANRAAR
jgi:hypothetical protein